MSATLDDEILQDDRDRNQRRMRIAAIIVAILTVAGAAYYFFGSGNTAPTDADKAGQAQTVTVVAPGRDSVARTINATGTLAARREIPVGIVGEGGRVLMVYVDAGDWVTQGQVLVTVRYKHSRPPRLRLRPVSPALTCSLPKTNSTARCSWLIGALFPRQTWIARPRRVTPPARG